MARQRIMFIECKGDSLTGEARIGLVTYSKSGKSIHYQGKTFETLNGTGFKANYFDVETREHYWIDSMASAFLFLSMRMFAKPIG
jgi:hypothetical protein